MAWLTSRTECVPYARSRLSQRRRALGRPSLHQSEAGNRHRSLVNLGGVSLASIFRFRLATAQSLSPLLKMGKWGCLLWCIPQTREILRVFAWVVAGLCVIVLTPAAAIRVDQYRLRRNAERLLADLKSLEVRKSTYHDARKGMDRCRGSTLRQGPCESNRCDVEIGAGDFFEHHTAFFMHHERLARVWRVLGGRPAVIARSFRVRKNIVWVKESAPSLVV
jgi:hypothetical protein